MIKEEIKVEVLLEVVITTTGGMIDEMPESMIKGIREETRSLPP